MVPFAPLVAVGASLFLSVAHYIRDSRIRARLAFNDEGMTGLQSAVCVQGISAIEHLIAGGSSVNERDRFGTPSICYAVKTHNPGIVRLFIKNQANLNAMDVDGRTALFYVEDVECAKLLLAEQISVNSRDIHGQTPLFFVRNDAVASELIVYKAEVNARDENGYTPLFFARTPEIAQVLIDAGADIFAVAEDGVELLNYVRNPEVLHVLHKNIAIQAIHAHDAAKLREVLQAHPDIVDASDRQGNSLFKLALMSRDRALIEAMIEAGADVSAMDAKGDSLVFFCIMTSNSLGVRLLCNAGADVNVRNRADRTTLRTAFFYRNNEILEILVRAGADVQQMDNEGKTPLFYAHNSDLIKAMGECGANPNARDKLGKTPIFYAEDDDDINDLVEIGADINARDNLGRTPLFYAASKRIIWALLKNNADVSALDDSGKDIFEANQSLCLVDEVYAYMDDAITEGDLERLKPLMKYERFIDTTRRSSTIFKAVENEQLDCLKLLIESGADINVVSRNEVLIVRAVRIGNEAIIKYLLDNDAVLSETSSRQDVGHYSLFHANHKGLRARLESEVLQYAKNSGNSRIDEMIASCIRIRKIARRC